MANDPHRTVVLDQEQILGEEKRVCEIDPYTLIRLKYLYIKNKKKELLPLIPNKVQQYVLDRVREKRLKKRPVRVAILKGRQFGISTLIEAILYACSSQWANTNALIMSDDEKGSGYLFNMTKLYDDELRNREPHLAPVIKYSNEAKLEFESKRSLILIDTAKNKDAGRKYTFHLAHLSECARYPYFLDVMLSLMQGVPEEDRTAVFLETTADGENEFCEWWREKEAEEKAGQTDWMMIFLSWKDHEEYSRSFITEAEKESFIKTMNDDERKVMTKHQLTLEQMNWRRYTIKDKCGGKLRSFHQEYPLTADEAFTTSGKRIFGDDITETHDIQKPGRLCEPMHVGSVVMSDNRALFIPMHSGHFKMYKPPLKGHRYVIASDSSDGIPGGDPACAQVLDRSTWEQVGVLHGNIPPDIFGDNLFALGSFYNWALIIPEINNQGLVTVLRLRDLMYPRVTTHERTVALDPGSSKLETTEELGWRTTEKNKPIIINDLQQALREMLIILHDEMTMKEIKHFSVLKDGKFGGAGGYHDDRVMALMLAVHQAKKIPDFSGETAGDMENQYKSNRRSGY